MSKDDFEKLQCEINEKALNQLGSSEGLEAFMVQVLESFSYRYLETKDSGELSVQKYLEEGSYLLFCRSLEYRMADALKCEDSVAKEGILALAKSVPKKERPCVMYEIFLDLSNMSSKGIIEVKSIINWGFPDFKDDSKKRVKKVDIDCSDLLALRKSLPLALENVCEIF